MGEFRGMKEVLPGEREIPNCTSRAGVSGLALSDPDERAPMLIEALSLLIPVRYTPVTRLYLLA